MKFLVLVLSCILFSSQALAEDVLVLEPTNCQVMGTVPGFSKIASLKALNVVGVCKGAPSSLFCTWWLDKKIIGTSVFKKNTFHSTKTYTVLLGKDRNEYLVITKEQHFSHASIILMVTDGKIFLITKVCTGQATITSK